jgi:hypothetical protein
MTTSMMLMHNFAERVSSYLRQKTPDRAIVH